MSVDQAFISVLTSDDYLPGLLVLKQSLKAVNSKYQLHVLLTPNISKQTIHVLDESSISHSTLIEEINNPTDVDTDHRWFSTYSKLAIFGLDQYKKIVYLDADMLILRNIDELFGCPHMSATSAGSMLPRKKDRIHQNLNSGLIVIEPSYSLFKDMMSKVGKIENLISGGVTNKPINGSDQDFINAYFSDWPNKKELHLDHKYNIFHYHLDEYNELFGFSIEDGPRPISVIHFASYLKPWNMGQKELKELENDVDRSMELKAIRLWSKYFNEISIPQHD